MTAERTSPITTGYGLPELAQALSAVATRLEPRDAIDTLSRAMNETGHNDTVLYELTKGLYTVAFRLELKDVAAILFHAMAKMTDYYNYFQLRAFAKVFTALVNSKPLGIIKEGALVPPLPPAKTLVEILKDPLCVGEARRIVLDALGTRYQRHFADQWDFVHFAEAQKLGLDFTSPPQRPEPLAATER
jgi:hypothetical protein